jgi:hypothetical protein
MGAAPSAKAGGLPGAVQSTEPPTLPGGEYGVRLRAMDWHYERATPVRGVVRPLSDAPPERAHFGLHGAACKNRLIVPQAAISMGFSGQDLARYCGLKLAERGACEHGDQETGTDHDLGH